jgi:putative restriction endonuclease
MRYWVGITDRAWYERLRDQTPDEINFWQPSPTPVANFLAPGVPFLFKLHAPDNFIVGGGWFVGFSALPARLAWEAFGPRNGVDTYAELRLRVEQYRGAVQGDPIIGCNLLTDPFFLEREAWIPAPASWPRNVVRGKTLDTVEAEALRLWAAVEERLARAPAWANLPDAGPTRRYGRDYLTHARLGQGTFRVLVTEAYDRRCAVTGEKTLPVLEAAHIKSYVDNGPHLVSNGLLLRADLHKLFDDFYLTVDEDLRLNVSRRIKEEFSNGREYYRYHGQPLASVPADPHDRPAADFLRWHNAHFLG